MLCWVGAEEIRGRRDQKRRLVNRTDGEVWVFGVHKSGRERIGAAITIANGKILEVETMATAAGTTVGKRKDATLCDGSSTS